MAVLLQSEDNILLGMGKGGRTYGHLDHSGSKQGLAWHPEGKGHLVQECHGGAPGLEVSNQDSLEPDISLPTRALDLELSKVFQPQLDPPVVCPSFAYPLSQEPPIPLWGSAQGPNLF